MLVKILGFVSPCVALFTPQLLPIQLFLIVGVTTLSNLKTLSVIHLPWRSVLFGLMFFGYMILSIFWSVDPKVSLLKSLKLFIFVGVGILLFHYALSKPSTQSHSPFAKGIFLGHICVCFIILLNDVLGGVLQQWKHISPTKALWQAGLFLSLSFWPVLLMCLKRSEQHLKYFLIIGISGLTFTALQYVYCDTPLWGVILGGMIGGILYRSRCPMIKYAMQCAITLAFITTPIICYYGFSDTHRSLYSSIIKDPSYLHRLSLWHETSKKIFEQPFQRIIFGQGIQTSRQLSDGTFTNLEYRDKNNHVKTVRAEKFGMHPHNIALQLWVELGIMGVLIGAWGFAKFVGFLYDEKDRKKRFCDVGFFTTAMVPFWMSIDMYQSSWLATLIILIYCMMHSSYQKTS